MALSQEPAFAALLWCSWQCFIKASLAFMHASINRVS